MNKRSIAITAALLVAGLIAGIGPAQAHRIRTQTIDVHSHYTEPAGSEAGAKCGGEPSQPECRVLFGGKATMTGTMWGDEDYDLAVGEPTALTHGKISVEGTAYFNGGVVGCGTGTYILEHTEGEIDMTRYDPLTDSAPGKTKWRVRPGSGTGELTNLISGSGVLEGTIHLAGGNADIAPYFGEGDLTGTVTCRV